ncbi:MAG: hypothetical protein ABGX16_16880 [Pirellulales bacterium]
MIIVTIVDTPPLVACDDCGCGREDGTVCSHHTHANGSTHSHSSAPVVSSVAGTAGTGSYY